MQLVKEVLNSHSLAWYALIERLSTNYSTSWSINSDKNREEAQIEKELKSHAKSPLRNTRGKMLGLKMASKVCQNSEKPKVPSKFN